jgi:hypothetical protein
MNSIYRNYMYNNPQQCSCNEITGEVCERCKVEQFDSFCRNILVSFILTMYILGYLLLI